MPKNIHIVMRIALSLVLGFILMGSQQSRAAPLITDDGTGKTRSDRCLLGYDFTVGNTDQTIIALGIWDDSASDKVEGAPAVPASPDGLVEAHRVGLWRASDGVLLGSVTVPAGTSGKLVGEFRYVTLDSPITLQANMRYTLGAEYYGADGVKADAEADLPQGPDLWHDVNEVPDPPIYRPAVFSNSIFRSFEARVGVQGTFTRPVDFSGGVARAYIGPNVLYAVPDSKSSGSKSKR
jgi:hypothetical protein